MEKQTFRKMYNSAKQLNMDGFEVGLHQFLTENGSNLSKDELLAIALGICYWSKIYTPPCDHNELNSTVLNELEDLLVD